MFWFLCLYNHCIFACYSECKHTYRIVLTTGVGRCQEISHKTKKSFETEADVVLKCFIFGIRNHCDNHNYHQSTSNLILVFLKTWSDCKLHARRDPNFAEAPQSGSLATRGGGKSWLRVERQLLGEVVTWVAWKLKGCNRKNQPNWNRDLNHLNDPPTICLGSMLIFQDVSWFPCLCVKTLGSKTSFTRNSTKFCYRL